MNFNYVGFRPVISQYGISYKQGKDDKYIYLPYVYELLNAVNSEFEVENNNSYIIKIDKLNVNKLYKKILELDPKLEDDINLKLENYKKNLKIESLEIKNRKDISKIEKEVYLNNLDYKKTYRINRAKNKIFYYIAILNIANLIKQKKIKKLNMPFNKKFWQILKTLQGVMFSQKITTKLYTQEKNGIVSLVFTINL